MVDGKNLGRAGRARRRPKSVALPMLAVDVRASDYRWDEPVTLTAKETAEMRARVAKAAQIMHEDDLRRVAAVAAIIEQDREWLAEYARRQREREELIKAVAALYAPLYATAKPKDRRRVPGRIARRVVERTMGEE